MSLESNYLKFLIPISSISSSGSNKYSATNGNIFSVKTFRNLVSGEDNELTTAYTHFQKMVKQEQGAVSNAALAVVEQSKGICLYA